MASRFASFPDRENIFMLLRQQIRDQFDFLIDKLIQRRDFLSKQVNQWEEEFNRTQTSCIQSLEGMKREQSEMEQLLATLKINKARTTMEKGILDLSEEISEKERKLQYPQIRFVCDRNDFETKISKFGSLTRDTDNVLVRNYTQLSKPVKVFGSFGKGKGRFYGLRGVAIDTDSQRIFIADMSNNRIQVWSLEGEYLCMFGRNVLCSPWEIVLSGNFIYISNFHGSFLSKWCMNTLTLVKNSNTSLGIMPGQLQSPSGLDIEEEEIFVVELSNTRISVFDLNLDFKRIMADNAIAHSHCLRVRNGIIYIIEKYCGVIKLFSKTNQLLEIISMCPFFQGCINHFNFDSHLNFFITDSDKNSLFILSREGDLIHSLSFDEYDLHNPLGIDISEDGSVVICFQGYSNDSSPIAKF